MITMPSSKKVARPVPKADSERMTADERIADMKAFGREIRQSQQSAQEFLIRAGILTPTGKLTKPFRG